MTDLLASLAVAIGESLALSLIVKATIAAAAGLLVARAMRKVRASRRYLVLAWTFVVLGAMPVLALLAGPLAIVVRENESVAAPAPATSAALLNGERDLGAEVAGGPSVVVPTSGRYKMTAGELAAAGWAIGILVCLLPMVRTLRRLRLLRRTARVWKEGEAATILRHEDVTVPMTFGLLQPVVLLPNDIAAWSDADVERALAHELEHVRRRDWPVHLFVRFICALYWFHPVVWRAGRQLYLEADLACDDAVVRRGDGDAFADQLVALAGRLVSRVPAVVPSMAGGDLSTRVLAMVNPRQARGRAGVACRLLAGVVALACGAAIAPLRAVEATRVSAAGSDRLLSPAEPANERSAVDRVLPLVASVVRRAPVAERVASLGASMPVTDSAPAFEVASIRPSPQAESTPPVWAMPQPGGRWTTSEADIPYIVSQVYGYELPGQVVGAPEWAIRARFDINAKAEGDPPPATLRLMAQRLLTERFKLKFHIETRPVEAYVLVPARSDGALGPGLTPPVVDCEAWAAAGARRAALAPLPPQPRNRPSCGVRTIPNGPIMRLAVGGMPAETLAFFIQAFLRNAAGLTTRVPVLDRTGLKGRFDIELEFLRMAPSLSVDGAAAPAGQTIFDAVRDQLGLKLEKRTEPIDVFVIDHVEMPTTD